MPFFGPHESTQSRGRLWMEGWALDIALTTSAHASTRDFGMGRWEAHTHGAYVLPRCVSDSVWHRRMHVLRPKPCNTALCTLRPLCLCQSTFYVCHSCASCMSKSLRVIRTHRTLSTSDRSFNQNVAQWRVEKAQNLAEVFFVDSTLWHSRRCMLRNVVCCCCVRVCHSMRAQPPFKNHVCRRMHYHAYSHRYEKCWHHH